MHLNDASNERSLDELKYVPGCSNISSEVSRDAFEHIQ